MTPRFRRLGGGRGFPGVAFLAGIVVLPGQLLAKAPPAHPPPGSPDRPPPVSRTLAGELLPTATRGPGAEPHAWASSPSVRAPGVQEAVPEQETRELRGEVVRNGDPVPGQRVTLHRVSGSAAGELERRTTDDRGLFTFLLPSPSPTGESGEDTTEVYFASVRHQGILYFGPALTRDAQLDSVYRIEVFDTLTAPPGGADLLVAVRNLFVERHPDGGWQVVDLLQVRNDTSRTLVAGEGDVVWSYPLPGEGRTFEVVEGESGPGGATIFEGGLSVTTPLPPGERTFIVRYRLEEPVFSLPMPGRSGRVEMLVEQPAPPLEVTVLRQAESVELEQGRSYRRYAGAQLTNRVVEVEVREEESRISPGWIAVILGLVLTGGAAFVLARREGLPEPARASGRGGTAPLSTEVSDRRSALLLQVAELDRRFQEKGEPTERERSRYQEERARLLERIRDLG